MKKSLIMMVAAAMIATTTMAQTDSVARKRPKMDQTEMVKKRTEGTAKRYGLNEEQTAKLLELNTKYAKNMRPMRPMGRMRPGQPGKQGGDSLNRPKPNATAKAEMDNRRKKMEEEMTAYNKELQSIMTEEQYKSYQADMQKRMLRKPDRNQGESDKNK